MGPQQTVSGRVQATVESARQQAKAIDEQKGISKTANDVSKGCSKARKTPNIHLSTTRVHLPLRGARRSRSFTLVHPNRSTTFMKRHVGLPINIRPGKTWRKAHPRQLVRALLNRRRKQHPLPRNCLNYLCIRQRRQAKSCALTLRCRKSPAEEPIGSSVRHSDPSNSCRPIHRGTCCKGRRNDI